MKTIQFTEFRKTASEIMTAVEHGESYLVVRHGRAIAEIVPVESSLPSWKRQHPRLRLDGASLAAAIIKEREHESLS